MQFIVDIQESLYPPHVISHLSSSTKAEDGGSESPHQQAVVSVVPITPCLTPPVKETHEFRHEVSVFHVYVELKVISPADE
jgi:hypothetical protein